MHKYYTVIVILEAKPGKENELESELKKVAEYSRAESTNIEYKLNKSIDNPKQFILYENWVNKEMHQAQFEKPYIKNFANKLEELLAKPYEAFFSELVI